MKRVQPMVDCIRRGEEFARTQRSSMIGLDVLGAAGSKGILVRVKSVPELVQQKTGGWQGSLAKLLAQDVVPETIENKVYSEMKKKLIAGFKEQGVDADVSVVVPTDYKSSAGQVAKHVAVGGVIGAGFVGAVWGLVHFFWGRR